MFAWLWPNIVKKRPNIWTIALVLLLCGLLIGFASVATIVSREGVDGVFQRKRKVVKEVMPGALPLVDEVEQRVKGQK